jgi:hypothetical protein
VRLDILSYQPVEDGQVNLAGFLRVPRFVHTLAQVIQGDSKAGRSQPANGSHSVFEFLAGDKTRGQPPPQ